MLNEDVTLNDEQIFSNRLECDKNTLRWVETDLSAGPGPASQLLSVWEANIPIFSHKSDHHRYHTLLPLLVFKLCCVLDPSWQNGPESCCLRLEIRLEIGLWRRSVGVTLGSVMEILTCSQPGSRPRFRAEEGVTSRHRHSNTGLVAAVSYCLQISASIPNLQSPGSATQIYWWGTDMQIANSFLEMSKFCNTLSPIKDRYICKIAFCHDWIAGCLTLKFCKPH